MTTEVVADYIQAAVGGDIHLVETSEPGAFGGMEVRLDFAFDNVTSTDAFAALHDKVHVLLGPAQQRVNMGEQRVRKRCQCIFDLGGTSG